MPTRVEKPVSILILMDIALKEDKSAGKATTYACFNPYSDGYCSERLNPLWFQQKAMVVSILILMDIALKVFGFLYSTFRTPSFNPYSDGYCSESAHYPKTTT